MTVAVTAASGKLGRLILEALKSEIGADRVIGIARSPDNMDVDGIEVRRANYESAQELAEAFAGVDTVLMISSPVGPQDRIALHRNVIEAAKTAGARKILYTSVIGNGLERDSLYGPTAAVNRQTEADLRDSGLEWVVGRNGFYLDIDIEHVLNAAESGVFRNSAGDGRCCYMTRAELAEPWARLATEDRHNGKIFNLVGDSYSQGELVAIVNDTCGLDVAYEAVSDDEFRRSVPPERGELVADMITGCYQCIRAGAFDVESDFEAAAGRAPKSAEQMIRDYCAARP